MEQVFRSISALGFQPFFEYRNRCHSVHPPPPSPPSTGGAEPPTKFSKKGAFSRRGCNFSAKNKLKSGMFNDKRDYKQEGCSPS